MSDITEHNKLVRDKFPEKLKADGVSGKFHEADHDEYEIELLEKLREEVLEFKNAKSMEELADLLEVVDAVVAHFGWKQEDVQAMKAQLLNERGGYTKHLMLEQIES